MSEPFSRRSAARSQRPTRRSSRRPRPPAVIKFKSCRWRRPPEDGPECCGHRDVLPIAGTSFNPEAWCPDCQFFKLRRTPKSGTRTNTATSGLYSLKYY